MEITNSAEELRNAVFTSEENDRISKGEKAQVYLEVKDASATITDADKAVIQSVLGDSVVGMYFDISLMVQVGNSAAHAVTDCANLVTISVKVPESLINQDNNIIRRYQVIRVHNGEAAIINGVFDAETANFTFDTDAFSAYALVYTDTQNTIAGRILNAAPGTGDSWNGFATVVLCFMLAGTCFSGIFYSRKRR